MSTVVAFWIARPLSHGKTLLAFAARFRQQKTLLSTFLLMPLILLAGSSAPIAQWLYETSKFPAMSKLALEHIEIFPNEIQEQVGFGPGNSRLLTLATVAANSSFAKTISKTS